MSNYYIFPLPKDFMPVLLHKADIMEWNIQSTAHPTCIFCILDNRADSHFICEIPVLHKHTNNIITWVTKKPVNVISIETEFQDL
jgi:hypothetical protein